MQITIHGIELEIDYAIEPGEKRNHGHPDNRLPDVEPEITELAVIHQGEDITDLLSDSIIKLIEKEILK